MSLLNLFFLFMYIGFSTIGGGLVAISLMQQELISRSIISAERFIAMIAISESTPGPMGINMATYIGYELYGVWGSVVLTAGIVLPSLMVIVAIAYFSAAIQNIPAARYIFFGLRAGAAGMITSAAWTVLSVVVFTFPEFYRTYRLQHLCNWNSVVLFFVFLLISLFWRACSPVVLIVTGGIVGMLIF